MLAFHLPQHAWGQIQIARHLSRHRDCLRALQISILLREAAFLGPFSSPAFPLDCTRFYIQSQFIHIKYLNLCVLSVANRRNFVTCYRICLKPDGDCHGVIVRVADRNVDIGLLKSLICRVRKMDVGFSKFVVQNLHIFP